MCSDSCTCGKGDFEQGHSAGVQHGVGCKQGIRPRASSLNFNCDFWHQRVNDNPWCGKLFASGQLRFLRRAQGELEAFAVVTAAGQSKQPRLFSRGHQHCQQTLSIVARCFAVYHIPGMPTDLDLGTAPCFRTWCWIPNDLVKKFREIQVHQKCMDDKLYIGNTSWSLTKTEIFYRLFGIWAVGCRDVVSCDKLALASGFEAIQLTRFCKPRITLIMPLLIDWSCSNTNIFHIKRNLFFKKIVCHIGNRVFK